MIVATSGCFDLLTVGHLDLIDYCHSFGGELIIGINSDDSVQALKGEDRPINTAADRRRILLALKYVEHVYVFYESSAYKFLRTHKPDIWIKGGTYSLDTLDPLEKEAVGSYGGKILFFPHVNHRSTTDIVERIRGRNS